MRTSGEGKKYWKTQRIVTKCGTLPQRCSTLPPEISVPPYHEACGLKFLAVGLPSSRPFDVQRGNRPADVQLTAKAFGARKSRKVKFSDDLIATPEIFFFSFVPLFCRFLRLHSKKKKKKECLQGRLRKLQENVEMLPLTWHLLLAFEKPKCTSNAYRLKVSCIRGQIHRAFSLVSAVCYRPAVFAYNIAYISTGWHLL